MLSYSDMQRHWNGRNKTNHYRNMRAMGLHNCELFFCERSKTFYIEFHRNKIVECTEDNVMMLHSYGWYDSPTTRARIYDIAGVSISSDRRTTGLETTTRLNNLPVTGDMKFRNGECINPEVCVDRITRLQKSAVSRATKKLKTLRDLGTTMARMSMFRDVLRKGYAGINIDAPTAEDAEAVYMLGRPHSQVPQLVTFKAGLAVMREHLYKDDPAAYVTEEIRYGNDQRQAA